MIQTRIERQRVRETMKFYFAPMEGVTGYIFRSAYHDFFGGVDKYYAPFISPNQNHSYKSREINDVLPENNKGMNLIPQILTNKSVDFNHTCEFIKELGYEEVNLNLGCPSGTVVAKKRGSGFLAYKDELRVFLDEIFTDPKLKISIKTRLGKEEPEEFYELMEIYNQYPIEELTIHSRIQKDFYKGHPRMEFFDYAVAHSKIPLCYNGDIFTVDAYRKIAAAYDSVDAVMLGRGLIANPNLLLEIKGQQPVTKERFLAFHDRILHDYQEVLSGDRNVLFKMKELWCYMIHIFSNHDKHWKKIRKAERLSEYKIAVANLLREEELVPGAGYKSLI